MAKFDRSPFRVSVQNGRVVCVVTYDKEWQEYRVRISVDGSINEGADYFTDCPEDAECNAHAMVKHAAARLQPVDVVLF